MTANATSGGALAHRLEPAASGPGETRAGYPLHPLVIIALLLWLVNDHLLKEVYPGWWTGKLSDIAGLAVFPLIPYAAADLWRERRGLPPPAATTLLAWIAVTGLAMVAIKTFGPAAGAYRWGLGAVQWPLRVLRSWSLVGLRPVHLTQDPTDLLALPALLVPWCVARAPSRPQRTRFGA